jgi:hypothetical protein
VVTEGVLRFKKNVFSQNGEDGIVEALFQAITPRNRVCCEFGASDGVRFSNSRRLILDGWKGIMIEADLRSFQELTRTYASSPNVSCVNASVDGGANRLERILERSGLSASGPTIDFLSIDIDGLDYEILESLEVRPAVICIEVNGAQRPDTVERTPRDIAARNVGQSLTVMAQIAETKGYDLVCYTSNAFLVRRDLLPSSGLSVRTPAEAYTEYLCSLNQKNRDWLYLENRASVPPFHMFGNPNLTRRALRIGAARAFLLVLWSLRFRATHWFRLVRKHLWRTQSGRDGG